MPKERTLRKIQREIEAGDYNKVRSRLEGLMTTYHHDLEVRDLIGAMYRQIGDSAEAGKCIYLRDPRNDRERLDQLAFERKGKWPFRWNHEFKMLRQVDWRLPAEALPPDGQTRLVALQQQARRWRGSWLVYNFAGEESELRNARGKVIDAVEKTVFGAFCVLVFAALMLTALMFGLYSGVAWLVGRLTRRPRR